MSVDDEGVPVFEEMPLPTEPLPVEPPVDTAQYLDTQTLEGGEGYFHTENDPTHATDGTAEGQSPETELVRASRSGAGPEQMAIDDDGLDAMTKQELKDLADSRGVEYSATATKAQILEALRAQ
jgi:hypothetical protein